jgi:protein-S-isoprenylcysteine O-methyltransferase Ste14
MYTTFYLSIIGWTLLSANWLVGLSWAGLGVVVAFQTRTEEAALLAHFGGQYRAYQQRTGRFLPRLARQPNFYNW